MSEKLQLGPKQILFFPLYYLFGDNWLTAWTCWVLCREELLLSLFSLTLRHQEGKLYSRFIRKWGNEKEALFPIWTRWKKIVRCFFFVLFFYSAYFCSVVNVAICSHRCQCSPSLAGLCNENCTTWFLRWNVNRSLLLKMYCIFWFEFPYHSFLLSVKWHAPVCCRVTLRIGKSGGPKPRVTKVYWKKSKLETKYVIVMTLESLIRIVHNDSNLTVWRGDKHEMHPTLWLCLKVSNLVSVEQRPHHNSKRHALIEIFKFKPSIINIIALSMCKASYS